MLKKLSGLFFGWRMVAAASALRVIGAGLHSFGFTVFFLPLSQDLNLNRTSTSLAFSLARAEGAIEGPIVGHLLERYGPKPIMVAAVLLMGVGYLLLSQVHSYTTFLIVYLGVISLAHAGGFMHAPMVLINTWFIRHRARAITISSAAFGLGGVLVAPVLSVIVQTWGWRWGAIFGGVLFLVIGLPLCLTIRRSPESMGLLPDGSEVAGLAPGQDGATSTIRPEVEVTLAEALRSFAFWGSVLAAGIRNASYHAIGVHFVPLMVWKGLTQSEAALLLSLYAFLGMAVTLNPRLARRQGEQTPHDRAHLICRRRCDVPANHWQLALVACSCLRLFLPRWRRLSRLVGRWSAICSAGSITPRFAAIWSCSIHGEEFSVL